MKKPIEKKLKLFLAIAVFFAAFEIVTVYYLQTNNYSCLYLLPVIVMVACLWYIKADIAGNSYFLCFVASFFTFLLGRRVILRLTGDVQTDFKARIEINTDVVLMLALFGLLCGYVLLDQLKKRCGGKRAEKQPLNHAAREEKFAEIRKISKFFFYCAFPFWLLTMLDVAFFVLRNGYAQYYLSYSSSVPTLIRLIGNTAPMFFFVYLAMMPRKKEALLPILLYLLYSVASLATGRRLTLITNLMIVFAYALSRNKMPKRDEIWISKKMVIGLCVLVPFMLMGMYLFEYIRGDAAVGSASDSNPLFGFFLRQGVSVNVIKFADYFGKVNEKACYSLYSTLKWLSDSFIVKLFGIEIPFVFGKQSPEVALQGTSLAHFISYYVNPETYLAGMGYGSSYIAELYLDFGYLGVWIGSFLYGAVICLLFKYAPERGHRWWYAIGLFVLNSILVAPRASYDEFVAKLFYVDCWAPLVLMFLVSYNGMLNALTLKIINQIDDLRKRRSKWRKTERQNS